MNPTAYTSDSQTRVPIHDHRNRKVGEAVAGVFRKDALRASKHQLRQPPAWALDLQSLNEAKAANCDYVSLHDMESGRTYTAPLALFFSKGIYLNRGYGEQLALVLGYFSVDGRRPQIEETDVEPVKEVQLSFL